jgi:hypothetical protein
VQTNGSMQGKVAVSDEQYGQAPSLTEGEN